MAKVLRLDEMLEVMMDAEIPWLGFAVRLDAIANDMAAEISRALGVRAGRASTDDGATMVAFGPRVEGDTCPPVIAKYDEEGQWE